MSDITIHLIANAHIDPVWLWNWREGLNEGLITVRTILDLMDEYGELTFIRGEAAIYQHIERYDSQTFRRIVHRFEEGRWDVVGGTYVQPDTNLPSTETLNRHFTVAQQYFNSRFGRPARVAWATDSFGHSAGLPEILASSGITGFAFNRPSKEILPLAEPAFWWEGPGGSRVLAYRPPVGWYGCERDEIGRRLDDVLVNSCFSELKNVGLFYGLGNHGGGPSRRHLNDIRRWAAAHPDVRIVHSGLHRLFDSLLEEICAHGEGYVPILRGELNFCLRGCYVSGAKFKFGYRKAESGVLRAEKTNAIINGFFDEPVSDLTEAWESVLFNSFHDILPGTSIESAYEDQTAWLGVGVRHGQKAELDALNLLGSNIDTTVLEPVGDFPAGVSMLVWNSGFEPFDGHVELENCLDYRPILEYKDRPSELPIQILDPDRKPLPFQVVDTENAAFPNIPWRKRVVVPIRVPAMGWNVIEMAWCEGAQASRPTGPTAGAISADAVENGIYKVEAKVGDYHVSILRNGKSIFGEAGFSVATFDDPWGSWGGMAEEIESLDLSNVAERWLISAVKVLEPGPERATLWVRFEGCRSRVDFSFALYREREAVDVSARILWNERATRLKLLMPVGDDAEFAVPGGTVRRVPSGEVPGGSWVRVSGLDGNFGFASDALYGFDCKDGVFRASVVRGGRYAKDGSASASDQPWKPVTDTGELKFRFLFSPGGDQLPQLARELEQSLIVLPVAPTPGKMPRQGSLAAVTPLSILVLTFKPAEDGQGWILRVQETSKIRTRPVLIWRGEELELTDVEAGRIASWRIIETQSGWSAHPVNTGEFVIE